MIRLIIIIIPYQKSEYINLIKFKIITVVCFPIGNSIYSFFTPPYISNMNSSNLVLLFIVNCDPLIPYKKFTNLPTITIVLLRYNGVVKHFYHRGEGFEYVSKVLGDYVSTAKKYGEMYGDDDMTHGK
jgi:hypothetical protein